VTVVELDAAGRPIKCEVKALGGSLLALSITPSDSHYWKGFRLMPLAWLPVEKDVAEAPSQHRWHERRELAVVFEEKPVGSFCPSPHWSGTRPKRL